jgi:hypothetical protein
MNTPRILIALTGDRDGLVIATMPPVDEYTSGARLAVGSVCRVSRDDEAAKWRAWLWPSAGGVMHVTRSCEALSAGGTEHLRERLQKRADAGLWWSGTAAAEGRVA